MKKLFGLVVAILVVSFSISSWALDKKVLKPLKQNELRATSQVTFQKIPPKTPLTFPRCPVYDAPAATNEWTNVIHGLPPVSSKGGSLHPSWSISAIGMHDCKLYVATHSSFSAFSASIYEYRRSSGKNDIARADQTILDDDNDSWVESPLVEGTTISNMITSFIDTNHGFFAAGVDGIFKLTDKGWAKANNYVPENASPPVHLFIDYLDVNGDTLYASSSKYGLLSCKLPDCSSMEPVNGFYRQIKTRGLIANGDNIYVGYDYFIQKNGEKILVSDLLGGEGSVRNLFRLKGKDYVTTTSHIVNLDDRSKIPIFDTRPVNFSDGDIVLAVDNSLDGVKIRFADSEKFNWKDLPLLPLSIPNSASVHLLYYAGGKAYVGYGSGYMTALYVINVND